MPDLCAKLIHEHMCLGAMPLCSERSAGAPHVFCGSMALGNASVVMGGASGSLGGRRDPAAR